MNVPTTHEREDVHIESSCVDCMQMSDSEMLWVQLDNQNTIYHILGNEKCKNIPAPWSSEIGLLLPASKAYHSYVMYDNRLSRCSSLAPFHDMPY